MGKSFGTYRILFLFFLVSTAPLSAQDAPGAEIVEHLRGVFGDSASVTPAWIVLADSEIASVGKTSRSPFPDDTLRIFVCRSADTVAGYGIVDNVMGKSRFITYLLILRPGGDVAGLEILVYRESHGGEISNGAFRRQFTGLRTGDPMVPGRDIRLISGATISSRSVTAGVSRLLAAFALVGGRIR
jgi:hypothetical protein